MKKTQTMASLEELQKYSLINNLKLKIEELKNKVKRQEQIIDDYKRNTKTTTINEQEIEIQKLNDENKRLLLIIEDLREGRREPQKQKNLRNHDLKDRDLKTSGNRKKHNTGDGKGSQNTIGLEKKRESAHEGKYQQLLLENEHLHKKLIAFKTQESYLKKKNMINDRSSILLEKNINEADKFKQKNYELEVDLANALAREKRLGEKIDELEELLEKALKINVSMKDLDGIKLR